MDTEKVNDCINTLLFNKGELKSQEAKDIIDVLHQCVMKGPITDHSNANVDEMFNYPSNEYVDGHHYRLKHMFGKEDISDMIREIDDLEHCQMGNASPNLDRESKLLRMRELTLKLKLNACARNVENERRRFIELNHESVITIARYWKLYIEERDKNEKKKCWLW